MNRGPMIRAVRYPSRPETELVGGAGLVAPWIVEGAMNGAIFER